MTEEEKTAAEATQDEPVVKTESEEELPFYKKFDMDPKERDIDLKSIKAVSGMPVKVQDRFKALYILSHQRSQLNDAFTKEVEALEKKIQDRKAPIFAKRAEILSGENESFEDYIPVFE